MTKKEIIDQLRDAKMAHTTWKSYAYLIAKEVVAVRDDKMAPLVPTACEFGKWYYKQGAALSRLRKYKEIEEPHNRIHEIYADIYRTVHTELEKGLFESRKHAEEKRSDELQKKLETIDSYETILMNTIDQLIIEVENLSDADMSALFGGR